MITPSPRMTVLFLSLLLCVALVAACVVFSEELVVLYFQGLGGAQTRERLGFELRPAQILQVSGEWSEVWVFAGVRPDGPLALAGVREGDAWKEVVIRECGFIRILDVAKIFELLERTRSRPVRMEVINSAELQRAWWKERWWKNVRTIEIPVVPGN